MENAKPFYDLCINSKVGPKFHQFAKKCVEFGYKTIAIDHVHEFTSIDIIKELRKKKKIDKDKGGNLPSIYVPPPIQFSSEELDLTVLYRLTIICKDKDVLNNVINHENFQKYHIFAVNPKSAEMYQHLCDSIDADIITFDPLDIKGFKISRKPYKKAVSRGLYFELMYFPALVDQNARKNIITRSHVYYQVGKSENIIVTSGCKSDITIRGPYDVINLGMVFGLPEEKAKRSITSAGADVIKHAMSRRIGKAIVYITYKDDKKPSESSMEVDSDSDSESDSDETNAAQPMQKKMKTNENDIILLDS